MAEIGVLSGHSVGLQCAFKTTAMPDTKMGEWFAHGHHDGGTSLDADFVDNMTTKTDPGFLLNNLRLDGILLQ